MAMAAVFLTHAVTICGSHLNCPARWALEQDSVRVMRPRVSIRDPLFRRHSSRIAGSRLLSPDEAFSCRFDRWKSRGVAQSLSRLAPCLAPRTRHALR
jgi:hypothetical protein